MYVCECFVCTFVSVLYVCFCMYVCECFVCMFVRVLYVSFAGIGSVNKYNCPSVEMSTKNTILPAIWCMCM